MSLDRAQTQTTRSWGERNNDKATVAPTALGIAYSNKIP